MKRTLFIITFFIIGFGLIFSQSITVTNPHSGDTWNKDHTYNITWTHTGTLSPNVKIRLYQGSTRIMGIIDSTPTNNGSFPWNIPVSLDNGVYSIRVKTVDNAVWDESDSFTIAVATSPSGIITVTNPHTGDTWNKNATHNITWTHSGLMSPNVKIRLFQGDTRVLRITDSTPNDGSFPWAIPDSLENGTYKIRVKTIDNNLEDDSDQFNINGGVSLHLTTTAYASRDFEIKDIVHIFNRGGWLTAKIKNRISPLNGNLKFRVLFPDDPLPSGTTFNYTKHLNLNAGDERRIYLVPSSSIGDVPFCGKRVIVTIDPDNNIVETNERNNRMTKRIYLKETDLVVTAPTNELKIKKAYMKSSYRWRIKFKIHAKALGVGYDNLSNVRVRWRLENSSKAILYSHSFNPFSINLMEEKIINVDKKFGHPDKHRSIRPRLANGRYSIVVVISSTERLCEKNTRNNINRFSFNLH